MTLSSPALRLSLASLLVCAATASVSAQKLVYSTEHRDHEHTLPQTVSAVPMTLHQDNSGRTGVSLVVADFDSDGTPDLVSGYATRSGGILLLQRGNPRATAPTPTEWAIAARGELVAPYIARSEAIALPASPDLLVTTDFAGHGDPDLLAAAKGSATVYFLRGHGDGSFSAPQAIALAGPVTALATWRGPAGDNLLVAGVCGSSGCGLQFLDSDGATKAFVHTSVPVTAIQTGSINGGRQADFALLAGGQVLVLDGDSALKFRPTLEFLPITGASAISLGTFVPDHHPGLQVAVLGADATLHVITRAGIDASYNPLARHAQNIARAQSQEVSPASAPLSKRLNQPWTEAETVPNVGPGGAAIMLRARLSGSGNDDLAILAGGQYVTVAHPLIREGNLFRTTPVLTIDSTSARVNAAVATRVNADARFGIVSMGSIGTQPLTVSVPVAYRTMYVSSATGDAAVTSTSFNACKTNTSTAQSGCTLRAAITVANVDRASTAAAKVDTINIPAGTITLSALNTNSTNVGNGSYTTQNPDYLGSVNYHLELDASANLVGAGCTTSGTPLVPTSCSTLINANGIDTALVVDYGSFYATSLGDFESSPVEVFVSGLTLQAGRNPNSFASTSCQNYNSDCNPYGGNLQWTVEGASSLVLNNVLINGGTDPTYGGGGVSAFYDVSSTGLANPLEIDNSAITNNFATSTNEGGGGLVIENGTFTPGQDIPLVLTSDLISGNTTAGLGGGVFVLADNYVTTITNSKISGNTGTGSGSNGGGLYIEGPLTMSGTTVSGNAGIAFGGGLYSYGYTYATTITSSSFLNNSITGSQTGLTYPTDGGGVCLEAGLATGQSVSSIKYSRFHGNTGGHSTGLGIGCNQNNSQEATYAAVTATDNWWGCLPTTATNGTNGSLAGTGCDTAALGTITAGDGTLSTSPYTTLTLALNSTTPSAGTSLVATASLGQDSAGTVYPSASDAAYTATTPLLPSALISTFTITNTSTPTYNPSSTAFSSNANAAVSYAAATATGTANATGNGTATVTVDGATVTRTYTVTASDLTVTSAHSGNFKASDTADTYTLTVGNIGTGSTTGTVTVIDTLPSGFTATGYSGSGWSCPSLTSPVTCTSSNVVAASVTFPALVLTVSVSSADVGTYINNVAVSGGGELNTNNDTGTDSTIVVGTPTISEAFSPSSVAPNTLSTVTFTIGNPAANPVTLTGIGFTDTLPSGLTTNGTSSSNCGGSGFSTALTGSITFSGGTLAAGSTCTVTVGVMAAAGGSYTNTTGNVTASNSNAGGTASATLVVYSPPTVTAAFSPASVASGANSSLTFTISNPNSVALTGVGLVNNLPTGLTNYSSPGGTCGGNGSAGSMVATLSNATLAANSSCTFIVTVTAGTTAGNITDTSNAVTSTNGGTGGTASATIAIEGPASIAESFTISPVAPGSPSTVVFTLTNPTGNPVALTGVGFTDTLPSGLLVYSTPSIANSCGSGTATAAAGSNSITFSGASLAVGAVCTVKVQVSSSTSGSYTNTTGAVTSTSGGSGSTASATLLVAASRTILVSSPTMTTGYSALIVANAIYQGSTAPTGVVTFLVNGSTANVGTRSCTSKAGHINCSATYGPSSIAPGQYTITVTQAADANYVASSGTGTLTVSAVIATQTIVSVPSNTGATGTPITITANLASATGSTINGTQQGPDPTGTVTFYVTRAGVTTQIGAPAMVNTGSASISYTPPASGSHVFTAVYNPTGNFAASADSTGQTVAVQ